MVNEQRSSTVINSLSEQAQDRLREVNVVFDVQLTGLPFEQLALPEADLVLIRQALPQLGGQPSPVNIAGLCGIPVAADSLERLRQSIKP